MTRDRIDAYFRKKQEELAEEIVDAFRPRDARAATEWALAKRQAERILDQWIQEIKPGTGLRA